VLLVWKDTRHLLSHPWHHHPRHYTPAEALQLCQQRNRRRECCGEGGGIVQAAQQVVLGSMPVTATLRITCCAACTCNHQEAYKLAPLWHAVGFPSANYCTVPY